MSTLLVNLIAFGGPLLILGSYWFFFVYLARRAEDQEKLNWKRRLGDKFIVSQKEETAALTLIKETAVQESAFKSTIPKAEGLREWIQHSGVDIRLSIFIGICFAIGMLTLFILLFFFQSNYIFSFILSIACAVLLPWSFITFLTHLMKNKFLKEFPIALDIMRRGLRAGYSVDRALVMVAEQMTGRMGKIFQTIIDKTRLGEPIEKVLAETSNYLGIEDFRMLAIVIVLQRETGGSLAEAAENFSKIIRTREYMRKKTKALSAEVRITAFILLAIPFIVLGGIYFTSPSYLTPLFKTDLGNLLLLIGVLMLVVGFFIIIRMAYKENY